MNKNEIDNLCINTIRMLSIEGIQKAKSGHPGLPLGAAPMAYALWSKELKHNPYNSKWENRDRFILSAGHGSMLIYSLLHLFGYGLTIEDLQNFRQLGSKTPGHPEYGHTNGVEVTTGPLGQGIANAVGMAMAEAHLSSIFNKTEFPIVDHYTYALCGDGCMMEGISSEAASLAGTLALNKLIVLYDSNNISIEGNTDIAFREKVGERFKAYNWQVIEVSDGNDVDSIENAINEAKKDKSHPSLIIVKTKIGYGSPKEGTSGAHGEPLGDENILKTREFYKWNYGKDFHVPDEVKEYMETLKNEGNKKEEEWKTLFEKYSKQYPDMAKLWDSYFSGESIKSVFDEKDLWDFKGKMATRNSSGEILNKLANKIPNLFGGSADLAPSTKTYMKNKGDFSAEDRNGANLHFGVREHAMAAIGNGIAVHGGLRAYVSTFFVFSDYMKHSMRLSAIMKLPVTYVLTHDSIGVGEDGPTHEPIEQLAALRSIPNFTVFRPADSKEALVGWYVALTKADGPTALILSRQDLPLLENSSMEAAKGAYILKDYSEETPDMLLMATGSEVQYILEAAEALNEKGIKARVISMPSWELFEAQDEAYKENILPKNVRKRVALEAASSFGWHKYVGLDGKVISIDSFGASGPGSKLYELFNITTENVINTALSL
ncbi:transketolase [Clostridium sp. 19966]|uniref:transketolase n=1 Tax=Clostridium sp. 19966 TaxID=2768166 RepID=UPI0028DF25D8|nr:transketolase [Clostridium sp. 19966]MDT8716283.1 transketolase [Clostridium sp. 19966]